MPSCVFHLDISGVVTVLWQILPSKTASSTEYVCRCSSTAPEEEPMELRIKDCTVTPREGCEQINFIVGKNVKSIELERVFAKKLFSSANYLQS